MHLTLFDPLEPRSIRKLPRPQATRMKIEHGSDTTNSPTSEAGVSNKCMQANTLLENTILDVLLQALTQQHQSKKPSSMYLSTSLSFHTSRFFF
jgi:hypothetical protein